MKLTKDNLKFIEKYLENSDVRYFDIRMELTDHIASAVEEKMQSENLDFYDAFKEYMIVKKKPLLKQNSYSIKKSFEIILKGYYHPSTMIFVLLSLIITQSFLMYFGEIKTLFGIFIMCYFLFLIGLYLFIGKKGWNYSIIAYLGISMAIVYHIFNFTFGFFRNNGLEKNNTSVAGFIFMILLLTSFMVFIRLYFILHKKYRKIYLNQ